MSGKRKHYFILAAVSLLLALALSACAGAEGPAGPAGPAGPVGEAGPAGEPGSAGEAGAGAAVAAAEYAGSDACASCHEGLYNDFMMSGHPYKLNAVVDGQPPEYPFSEVPNPPDGYTWDDVAYVIGGYGWKARFIGHDGFIITGDADSTTQYNLYNDDLGMGENWVPYHAGEEAPYNCGTCHTTGYNSEGNQDDLPGLIGTWSEPGIYCEACHGPSSLHVDNSTDAKFYPEVNRDADLCGECHIRGDIAEIDASGAFTKHHEQYEDFYQSKHRALTCVDCHNPHAAVRHQDEAVAAGSSPGIVVNCENCHWEQEAFQPAEHPFAECVDCHMAPVSKSALGDTDRLRGDVASHLFAVNPFAESQFYEGEDGNLYAEGFITVPYACSKCHYEGGIPVDAETLTNFAQGYHDRP